MSGAGIATSASGALWMPAFLKVGAIAYNGSITWYDVPTANSYALDIARGPDGNMWFTEEVTGKIARITPAGVVTEFPVVPMTGIGANALRGIVTGADGNLWVAADDQNKIARVTTAGVVTLFPIPTPKAGVDGMALGPDGNVWFAEYFGGRIGRITPAGVITEYVIPSGYPTGITTGADGNIWFSESNAGLTTVGNAICRFSM
jgi:virginiamycin B lyase